MSISIQRLTLFAIFDALERDLRAVLVSDVLPFQELKTALSDEEYEKTLKRFISNEGTSVLDDVPYEEAVHFLDFLDTAHIINRNKRLLSAVRSKYFSGIIKKLEKCAPVRNSVMHGRPLNFEDFPAVCGLASELVNDPEYEWPALTECLRELSENETYIFGLDFSIVDESRSGAYHNLPFPDFDDTGFIGRQSINKQLEEALLGPFPVISIVGPGGVGKSALALKVAYDLLDKEDLPFDAVVWVSAKANRLTAKEVERIEDAIEDSLGLLSSVLEQFDETVQDSPEDQVVQLLSAFKILLVIDNLETVLDERLRRFITRTPKGSKILITSRIGLGSGDLALEVPNMTKSEARSYFRKLVQAYGAKTIEKLNDQTVDQYIGRLTPNPLFLKWFVTAVKSGSRPEQLLGNQQDVLAFCFENVIQHLSPAARTICNAFVAVPGTHSQPVIAQITDLPALEIEKALSELLIANIVSMRSSEDFGETSYDLMDLARAYLRRVATVPNEEATKYTKRHNHIRISVQSAGNVPEEQFYKLSNFSVKNMGQAIVAKDLGRAQYLIRSGQFEAAQDILDSAASLAPGYFEVERVRALLNYENGNYSSAREAYEMAIELNPDWAPVHYWYGGFLLRAFGDEKGALEQFEVAQELQPSSLVEREMARVHLYMDEFAEAREILNRLLSVEGIPVKRHTILLDLKVQCFTRQLEREVEAEDFEAALITMREVRDFVEKIPSNLRDEKLLGRISRVDRSINSLISGLAGSPQMDECQNLASSLRNISAGTIEDEKFSGRLGRARELSESTANTTDILGLVDLLPDPSEGTRELGVVVRIAESREFGFIRTKSGAEYYFHQAAVSSNGHRIFMDVGSTVSFSVGHNSVGPCATDVVLEFNMNSSELIGGPAVEAIVVNLLNHHTSSYGFAIIPQYGDILIRRADFENDDEWKALNLGDTISLDVAKNNKGIVGRAIKLAT